jgi:hypothetical protein
MDFFRYRFCSFSHKIPLLFLLFDLIGSVALPLIYIRPERAKAPEGAFYFTTGLLFC